MLDTSQEGRDVLPGEYHLDGVSQVKEGGSDKTREINERSIPAEQYKEDTSDKEAGETRIEEEDEGTEREDIKMDTSDKISKGVDEGQKVRRRAKRGRIVEGKKTV
ncbi:hypothetical protein BY996DRAFT_6408403 [Phakopsora pachyrhizi]|nr:hypothetical protein BY996DRAFT_6408403 [Phakopsora pachyrhizi]